MRRRQHKDIFDRAFEAGIILKGLDGFLESIAGLALLFLSPAAINHFVFAVTRQELSEDPDDFVARYLLHTAHGLTGRSVLFGSAYLLSHGLVKVVLVVALLKNKLWAYPWMIAFLVAFIGYQLYRLAVAPTYGMAGLTTFDAVIVWLTYREYRKQAA